MAIIVIPKDDTVMIDDMYALLSEEGTIKTVRVTVYGNSDPFEPYRNENIWAIHLIPTGKSRRTPSIYVVRPVTYGFTSYGVIRITTSDQDRTDLGNPMLNWDFDGKRKSVSRVISKLINENWGSFIMPTEQSGHRHWIYEFVNSMLQDRLIDEDMMSLQFAIKKHHRTSGTQREIPIDWVKNSFLQSAVPQAENGWKLISVIDGSYHPRQGKYIMDGSGEMMFVDEDDWVTYEELTILTLQSGAQLYY